MYTDALEIGSCPVGKVRGLVKHTLSQAGCPGFTLETRVTNIPLLGAQVVTLDPDVRMFNRRGSRACDTWLLRSLGLLPSLASACGSGFNFPTFPALLDHELVGERPCVRPESLITVGDSAVVAAGRLARSPALCAQARQREQPRPPAHSCSGSRRRHFVLLLRLLASPRKFQIFEMGMRGRRKEDLKVTHLLVHFVILFR